MANFKLSLLTPSGVFVSNLECSEVYIPTYSGEINVLPEHTHVLSKLNTGVLTAKTSSGDRHFSVSSGICKVLKDEIHVLAYNAEKPEDIDVERAKSALAKAESRLEGNDPITDVELIKFQRKLERAKTRLRLANLK